MEVAPPEVQSTPPHYIRVLGATVDRLFHGGQWPDAAEAVTWPEKRPLNPSSSASNPTPNSATASNRYSKGLDDKKHPSEAGFLQSLWASLSTYDEQGNLRSTTDASNRTTTFDNYDDAGNAGLITDPLNNPTASYYTDGQLTTTIDAAGGETQFGYQADGQLGSITQVGEGGVQITTQLGYDELGRLTKIASPQDNIFYEYNNLGQLKRNYTGGRYQ
jgi:YD repeat-containing protein